MPKFLLIPRDHCNELSDLSAEGMQKAMVRYVAWGRKVRNTGKLLDSNKLKDGNGRVLRRQHGRTSVTQGPFAEMTETISGYWIIEAKDYDEAVSIAADHPHLEYGTSLEIREGDEI